MQKPPWRKRKATLTVVCRWVMPILLAVKNCNTPAMPSASAQAQLDVAIQQYNANQAMILNSNLEDQPAVQQAATEVRNAWLALERTRIVSPMTGYVSRRAVQPGAQISPTTPLMAVVPATDLWVDANFKETQLANMRIGQPVTVITDIYGDDVKYTGKVVGLDMGTGSAFSLLPAQNATGNWIKVVQRLPVRVELDARQLEQHPLRIGLSTLVTVDTLIATVRYWPARYERRRLPKVTHAKLISRRSIN
ncbi:multidrug resistance secretion protein [Salmonella enterica subsp. enterica]|uniref:Multidrug resistance secretion protein n=1 Tax=Salmonella enterica I TaxID=59201 RepID=A0A3S4FG54_SALET|nr:multidrug resistance secretion protein [Salmonella enterica subsp. enterica]